MRHASTPKEHYNNALASTSSPPLKTHAFLPLLPLLTSRVSRGVLPAAGWRAGEGVAMVGEVCTGAPRAAAATIWLALIRSVDSSEWGLRQRPGTGRRHGGKLVAFCQF